MSHSEIHELRRARPMLGTIVELSIGTEQRTGLEEAIRDAFAEGMEVHRLMSFHEPGSDVTRLNRFALREAVRVDARTWHVLEKARKFFEASAGAFDATVAPQLVQWGYLPRHAELRGRPAQGYAHVELLPDCRVRFHAPVWIDLGGIAKGYAVDRMCESLLRSGVSDHVVNAGGDLRVGKRPRWVHVRHPGDPARRVPLAELCDRAVATSAVYFATRCFAGKRVHPIVAPCAREPAELRGSVSVMARDCITADALTKPVAVLGGGASRPLLGRFDASARWIAESGKQEAVVP
jgi:FAD:protein FMN transferase